MIGIAFAVCAFLAPVIGMVSGSATCGALVVVGYLMMTEIGEIDWSDIASSFPAFVTIIGIPFTYSIANGIGFGFISYCIIKVDVYKRQAWNHRAVRFVPAGSVCRRRGAAV